VQKMLPYDAVSYSATARLVVVPNAPRSPFGNPVGKNHRNRIWWGLLAYVRDHPEGMPVWKFREMARNVASGIKGDMDIDKYIERGLVDLVDN
jgi:hypothetical protein